MSQAVYSGKFYNSVIKRAVEMLEKDIAELY